MKWHKTDEYGPPQPGHTVLAWWPKTTPYMESFATAMFTSGNWHDPENDEDEYCEPAYWMPLPRPPE